VTKKSRVLITGATGFVGSHALEALMARDDVEVIAAVRDPTRLLPGFRGEIRVGDLRDDDYLNTLVGNVDVIVHAGNWTSLFKHRHQSRESYFRPTVKLVDMAIRHNVKRFINISTTSAAAPLRSADPFSRGVPRFFWPHLCNVVAVENHIRANADYGTTMVNLRLGIFAGRRYGLGILPILLPRLKTHWVPWVGGGKTGLPIIDGRDIGQAIALAATVDGLAGYEAFNVVGAEVPTVRQVITFLHEEFGYPKPHFGVSFSMAYRFATLMEWLDRVLPGDPLITRSIVHVLEETGANNERATAVLGYQPRCDWRNAVRGQVGEMLDRQQSPMSMARPIEGGPV
jgi:nucleoside-diphosphate-sugar epimerase